MADGWDEVAERLARTGARLHEEVLVVVDGVRDRSRHGVLPVPAPAAQGDDGAVEELLDRGRGCRTSGSRGRLPHGNG